MPANNDFSLKVIKDSTTPKLYKLFVVFSPCLKVIKDSTTPKLNWWSTKCYSCLKVIKDSTTPKQQL